MTKDEVKAKAKEYGLKVRENFMDDWFENLIIFGVGVIIGAVAAKVFL